MAETNVIDFDERESSIFSDDEHRRTDRWDANMQLLRQYPNDPQIEADVFQQIISELSEDQAPGYVPLIIARWDESRNSYFAYGDTLPNHALTALNALESKPENMYELFRRMVEVDDSQMASRPLNNQRMRAGAKKMLVSPGPSLEEADLEDIEAFNYDDRTMVRFQELSADGQTLIMRNFVLFDIPHKVWAKVLSDEYGVEVMASGQSILETSAQADLIEGLEAIDILQNLLQAVLPQLEQADKVSVRKQLDDFLHKQNEYKKYVEKFALEKFDFENDLAQSQYVARGAVADILDDLARRARPDIRDIVDEHRIPDGYRMSPILEKIAYGVKMNVMRGRLGMVTENPRTVGQVSHHHGPEEALAIIQREQEIFRLLDEDPSKAEELIKSNQLKIADANIECSGGCPVKIENLFNDEEKEMLKAAGINPDKENVYSADSLNKESKCNCLIPRVRSNGKNVVCLNCGEANAHGESKNVKKSNDKDKAEVNNFEVKKEYYVPEAPEPEDLYQTTEGMQNAPEVVDSRIDEQTNQ